MPKSIWREGDRRELEARVARLTPALPARWGRMTAPRMLVHLCDAFRMASGELPVAPRGVRALASWPLKQIIIYGLPLPRGAPTAPELLSREPAAWDDDMRELRARMDAFVRGGPGACAAAHPLFGRMSGRGWGVLAYKHTDHHLRQFGV